SAGELLGRGSRGAGVHSAAPGPARRGALELRKAARTDEARWHAWRRPVAAWACRNEEQSARRGARAVRSGFRALRERRLFLQLSDTPALPRRRRYGARSA